MTHVQDPTPIFSEVWRNHVAIEIQSNPARYVRGQGADPEAQALAAGELARRDFATESLPTPPLADVRDKPVNNLESRSSAANPRFSQATRKPRTRFQRIPGVWGWHRKALDRVPTWLILTSLGAFFGGVAWLVVVTG